MITYRTFNKNDIQEIDILFKDSMLSTLDNIAYIYFFILNYYKYLFLLLYLFIPFPFFIAVLFLVPTIFYTIITCFLFQFVYNNLPSSKLEHYLNPDNNILLLLKNNKIVGFSSFTKWDHTKYFGWMDYFFIDKHYHNQGYGKKLLDYTNSYIQKNYPNDYNSGKYIIGGTSSLQLQFWKRYAHTIEQTDYQLFGYTINKSIINISPIQNYQIYFNKNSKL